jgi:hypothetical protein
MSRVEGTLNTVRIAVKPVAGSRDSLRQHDRMAPTAVARSLEWAFPTKDTGAGRSCSASRLVFCTPCRAACSNPRTSSRASDNHTSRRVMRAVPRFQVPDRAARDAPRSEYTQSINWLSSAILELPSDQVRCGGRLFREIPLSRRQCGTGRFKICR